MTLLAILASIITAVLLCPLAYLTMTVVKHVQASTEKIKQDMKLDAEDAKRAARHQVDMAATISEVLSMIKPKDGNDDE